VPTNLQSEYSDFKILNLSEYNSVASDMKHEDEKRGKTSPLCVNFTHLCKERPKYL